MPTIQIGPPLFLALVLTPLVAQAPRLVADVHAMSSSIGTPSWVVPSPRQGDVLLTLNDGPHGTEMWRSDGTDVGTQLVVDLTPGLAAGTTFFQLGPGPAFAWFVTGFGAPETLWRTDGTAAGTQLLYSAPASFPWIPPENFDRLLGNLLFFNAQGSLARTDGTAIGTFLLPAPEAIVLAIRGSVAILMSLQYDLMLTDGNSVTTLLANAWCADLGPGQLVLHEFFPSALAATSTRITWLEAAGMPSITIQDSVYAAAVLDGTAVLAGTLGVWGWNRTTPPVQLVSYTAPYHDFVPCGSGLLFSATTVAEGREPMFTDGTLSGTRVLDLTPGPGSSVFDVIAPVGSSALLWYTHSGTGSEPWVTDGSLAGTTQIGDLEPGAQGSTPETGAFVRKYEPAGRRRIVLPIETVAAGRELWITDGTSSGTALLADVLPGSLSSLPFGFDVALAGNKLVYWADDGISGFEPWAIDIEGAARPLRTQGTRVFAVGDPVLGATWNLRCWSLQPVDAGLVAIGLPLAVPLELGAGQLLHFDPFVALFVASVVPDPNGEWTTGIALPNDPSVAGFDLIVQPLFTPSLQPVGVDVGPAWWLTLGF